MHLPPSIFYQRDRTKAPNDEAVPSHVWLRRPGILGPRMLVDPRLPGSAEPVGKGVLRKWFVPHGAELLPLTRNSGDTTGPRFYLLLLPTGESACIEWTLTNTSGAPMGSRLALVSEDAVPAELRPALEESRRLLTTVANEQAPSNSGVPRSRTWNSGVPS